MPVLPYYDEFLSFENVTIIEPSSYDASAQVNPVYAVNPGAAPENGMTPEFAINVTYPAVFSDKAHAGFYKLCWSSSPGSFREMWIQDIAPQGNYPRSYPTHPTGNVYRTEFEHNFVVEVATIEIVDPRNPQGTPV